jgi:bacterioferritin (cytochrome b1)
MNASRHRADAELTSICLVDRPAVSNAIVTRSQRVCDASRIEVLDCDLQLEMSARARYQEAATHGHSVKDYVTHDLFEVLTHDEQKH